MTININNINAQNSKQINKNEKLTDLVLNSLESIEHKSKTLKIKEIKIKENIRSIKNKEKKYSIITEQIATRKEELKLLKQLLYLKEQNNIDNPEEIISIYLDFIISSNNLLNDKLTSLMEKEININMKQKFINKLLNEEINDVNYDLSISESITKPVDINKFLLLSKKKEGSNDDPNNFDNFFMNRINNNNLFTIKKNSNLTNSFKKDKINNYYINQFINKDLTKYQQYNNNTINFSKILTTNNSNNNSINNSGKEYNNISTININSSSTIKDLNNNIYTLTDKSEFINYNLKPNKKLKSARNTFKKLLNKINKSNEILFSTNKNNDLKDFIFNVLNTQYFLRKILYICYQSAEIYNINKQESIETIHEKDFISKLIEDYEDIGEKYDLKEKNNLKLYEEGLEEIKKITLETKNLENLITNFAHSINIYE